MEGETWITAKVVERLSLSGVGSLPISCRIQLMLSQVELGRGLTISATVRQQNKLTDKNVKYAPYSLC